MMRPVLVVAGMLALGLGLTIVILSLAGCGSPRRGEPLAGPTELASPEVSTGRIVFMQECHRCHPGGEEGLGPSLNEKPLPGFLMKFQVRHGLGAMPAFDEGRISDGRLDDLIAYIKALRAQG